ncbi:MAG: hypothetical protein ACOC22_00560 [bacterium]
MKRKIVDYEPGEDPWVQEEKKHADELIRLQEEYLKREKEEEKQRKKIDKLAKKKISDKNTKELEKKADNIKKLYVLDYWLRCFNRVSFCNPIPAQAFFHVCLGQAFHNYFIYLDDDSRIDWRLHFLWIQDSGSGKGKAMNFLNKVYSKLQKVEVLDKTKTHKRPYKTHKLGRMNPASLINTYQIDKKGNIMKDQNGIERVKKGIVESYDVIYSEEGRALLQNTEVSFELQEIFMTAVEAVGTPNNIYTKTLTNYDEPCETRSTASFIITTRPFGKVKQTLVESGMIQRFIFFPRKLTFEDREEMNRLSSFAFKRKDKKSPFENDFNNLIEEMKKVVSFGIANRIDFNPDQVDDCLSFLHEKMMYFTRDVEYTIPSDDNRYILQSFVSRYKENMITMAFHSAIMRFSKWVELEDLQYAYDYFEKLYQAQKFWVGIAVEEDKRTRQEEQELKKEIERVIRSDTNDLMDLSDLVNTLSRKFDKDYNSMYYHVKKLSRGSNPYIEIYDKEEGDKRKKGVRLVD